MMLKFFKEKYQEADCFIQTEQSGFAMTLLNSVIAIAPWREKQSRWKTLTQLRASALLYAVVMTAVFSIMGSALLMNGFFRQMIFSITERPQHLYHNALSGINIGMELKENEQLIQDLYETGNDSVKLSAKKWGAYSLVTSTAIQNGETMSLIGLTGQQSDKKISLYIQNSERPLSVCGKTIINGDCYLPGSDIKRAYIEGKSFEGNKMISGNLYNNKKKASLIQNKKINDELVSFFDKAHSTTDSIVSISNIEPGDSLINSFGNKTILIYSASVLRIQDITLKGNILLIAHDSIVINESVRLEDVILFAKKIRFQEKCDNKVQAFATDTIIIGNECVFGYPSIIALVDKNQNKTNPLINIKNDCSITGDILSFSNYNNQLNSCISIDRNCTVTGNIYSAGSVDMKGSLHGSLYCGSVILKTASSYYENHLLDTELDVYKRPKYYAGAIGMSEKENKVVVKWVE